MSAERCFETSQAYEAEGKLKAASQMLQVAISKAPTDPTYRKAHAHLLAKMRGEQPPQAAGGDPDELQRSLDTALAIGELERAYRSCHALLAHRPGDAPLRAQLGGIALRLHGPEKAAAWGRKALHLNPECLEGLILLAEVEARLGHDAQAAEMTHRAEAAAAGEPRRISNARQRLLLVEGKAQKTETEDSEGRRGLRMAIGAGSIALALLLFLLNPFGVPELEPLPLTGYQAVAPVTGALTQPDNTTAILTVDVAAWGALGEDARKGSLEDLLEVAVAQGFERILVQSPSGSRLGYADRGRVVLSVER